MGKKIFSTSHEASLKMGSRKAPAIAGRNKNGLVDQNNECVVEGFPVQSLAAAVTVSLVFPIKRDPTAWANRKGAIVAMHMDFRNSHWQAE